MTTNANDLTIRHNESESRFEARLGDEMALAAYELDGSTIIFTHTEVPEAFEGKGVAGRLVQTALDEARRRKLKVVPQCAYVASWIERHSEYADLVSSDVSA